MSLRSSETGNRAEGGKFRTYRLALPVTSVWHSIVLLWQAIKILKINQLEYNMNLKFIAATVAAFGASAIAAQAGSLSPAVEQAPVAVMQPQPVTQMRSGDWTGAYGGLSFGGSDIDATVKPLNDLKLEGDGNSTGIFAGYNYQMGNIVIGGEFDFDATNYRVGEDILGSDSVLVESTARLKARLGVPVGNGLLYGVAGVVGASTNTVIPDAKTGLGADFAVEDGVGYLVGAGYDMRIGDNLLAGAEVLYHEFDDDVLNVEVTTFRLRVGYRF